MWDHPIFITKDEKKIRGFRGVIFLNFRHFFKNKHEIYNASCKFLINLAKSAKKQSQLVVFWTLLKFFWNLVGQDFLKGKFGANLLSTKFARNFPLKKSRPTKFQKNLINVQKTTNCDCFFADLAKFIKNLHDAL